MTDVMQLHIALRKLELLDTHAVQALHCLGMAVAEEVRPPRLVIFEIEYPPQSQVRYSALVTQQHAGALRELIDGTLPPAEVIRRLAHRRKEMKKFADDDILKDFRDLLDTAPDDPQGRGARADATHIHTALRQLELADTHLVQGMRALAYAFMEYQQIPRLVYRRVKYPPGSTDPYIILLSRPHADWVRDNLDVSSPPDAVLRALLDRLAKMAWMVMHDIFGDFYKLLTHNLVKPFHPGPAPVPPAGAGEAGAARALTAAAGASGGDPPPLGCCTLPNGTKQKNLTQSQCLAYGTGASWQNTGGECLEREPGPDGAARAEREGAAQAAPPKG
jgi:hypothetical protein